MPSRLLSEPEYNAIKAQVVQSAPDGLSSADFGRYIGPAMEQALGTAENLPATPQGSALGRFASGVWQNVNPMGIVQAIRHPLDTAGAAVSDMGAQFGKAAQDYQQGHYSEMLGHAAAGAVPLIGPAAARAGEAIGSGDVAGGLGQGAGLVAPFAADAALTKGPGLMGRALPSAAGAAADVADRAATKTLVDVGGPKVGANKVRLTNKLADVAPTILRQPDLGAYSRTGLAAKVADKLDQATTGLDDASDARLPSQQVTTAPIVAQITQQIDRLTAAPAEADRPVPAASDRTPTLSNQNGLPGPPAGVPIGEPVEPSPNAAQIATLKQMRSEVSQLGPVAPYESVRRIREAWDQVARVKFLPSTAQDALTSQGTATAAAKGTGAMREALAATDPASAAAYQTYSLYRSANDVLQAAEEADRARPRVGRGIMARATGAVAGTIQGGPVGGVIGAVVGGVLDHAAQAAPTLRIVWARRLAGLADALRQGDTATATNIATRLKASLPATSASAINAVPQAAENPQPEAQRAAQ